MKLKTTLLAVTLAAFAASSAITFAAEALPADTKSETPKAEKAKTKKPVKKHSHMEEKTGMSMPEPVAGSTTTSSDKAEADKHDHTKDRH